MFCPLNNHLSVTGASPFTTAQGTVTSSPSLRGRSPKVKGRILGGTGTRSKLSVTNNILMILIQIYFTGMTMKVKITFLE
jgi:hypothetical protein